MAPHAPTSPRTDARVSFVHAPAREDSAPSPLPFVAAGHSRALLAATAAGARTGDGERALNRFVLLNDIVSPIPTRVRP